MNRIVEFSHPGLQFKLSTRSRKRGQAFEFDSGSTTTGVRYWNNENTHFRKFIKTRGKYILNEKSEGLVPEVQEGELLFWGEFEAPSRFTKLDPIDSRLYPNAIHEPFMDGTAPGLHNTDPYVFGDYFYYSNCKQLRGSMTALAVGSVILFGTEYAEGFALDTVFVVGERISAREYLDSKETFSPILRRATLDHNHFYNSETKLVLYKGKMFTHPTFEEDELQIFSFFPCKPFNEETRTGFQRPLLDYSAFNLQSPGAGTVLYNVKKTISDEEVNEYWQKVVAEVIAQGYSLGVYAEEPPMAHHEKFDEQLHFQKVKNSQIGGCGKGKISLLKTC
ncbi:MAG: hypothetical protein EOP48_01125 [Sphingobacteriales bacterium]|nr:MAG: hypothetical protein EOP48_01125 [Sphingobacteriales bacterium]